MYESTDDPPRYLVRYSDGGSGMRRTDAPIDVGQELRDGGSRYRVVHVEHPANAHPFGHARVELIG